MVIVDRDWKGRSSTGWSGVGRYHASRTVLCAVEEGRQTIDAIATVSYEEPNDGQHRGPARDTSRSISVPSTCGVSRRSIDPVIVSELPTVVWSPHGHDEAVEALLRLIDVILIDSDDLTSPGPEAFCARRATCPRHAYVVDLAWLRTTPWRERLAAGFDLAGATAAAAIVDWVVAIARALDRRGAAADGLAGLPA